MLSICIEEAPEHMSLSLLAEYCARELRKHRHKEAEDDRYCVELLHRALVQRIDQSWSVLQELFSDTVRIWFRSHPYNDIALRQDTEENYVALTFARFWYATRGRKSELCSLHAALGYLRATLNALLIDTMRSHLRTEHLPLPEPGFPNEPATEDVSDSEDLWDAVKSFITDARERRVAYLLYYCGLKPREIVLHCPDEFQNVKEVYRLNCNIIDRLRRNRDRLRWLLGESEQEN